MYYLVRPAPFEGAAKGVSRKVGLVEDQAANSLDCHSAQFVILQIFIFSIEISVERFTIFDKGNRW